MISRLFQGGITQYCIATASRPLRLALALLAADDPTWTTDFAAAKTAAQKNKKVILANFTGSDWCGWCIKLDKEVFSQDEFKKYAKDHFILVKLDFPKRTPQAAELKKQNEGLAQKYQIAGFPTVLVVDAAGAKLGRTGYMEGGPAVFNGELKKILTAAGK